MPVEGLGKQSSLAAALQQGKVSQSTCVRRPAQPPSCQPSVYPHPNHSHPSWIGGLPARLPTPVQPPPTAQPGPKQTSTRPRNPLPAPVAPIPGGALLSIQEDFGVGEGVSEVIVGAAKLGAVCGTFLGGALMLYYGRRVAIAVDSAFFITGPLLMSAAQGVA